MTQNAPLNTGDPAAEAFFDATQEMLSGAAVNFRLELVNPTTIRAPAGTGHDQVSLSIEGQYRFVTAAVTRAMPPGAAGAYDVFATTGANDPDTHEPASYAFALAIVAAGGSPAGVDLSRLVGHLTWDGAAITSLVDLWASAEDRIAPRIVLVALPTGSHGREILYQTATMAAAGVGPWLLRYDSALAGTSKWKVIAGEPWVVEFGQPGEGRVGAGYGDLARPGPAITLPVTGDYEITHASSMIGVAGASVAQSIAIGIAAASEDDRAAATGQGGTETPVIRSLVKTGLAAGTTITVKYGSGSWIWRRLAIRPLRLG